jgi:rhodanese-related sulfurtransferase
VTVVDIQPAGEYEAHHFKNSIETNAFPAKADKEKKKLDRALTAIKASKNNVVIICPRGRSGASNTYDHLKVQGVYESRLFILEGGVEGWPYTDTLVQGR